jgi:excisionase family DNA binding protein
MTENPTTKMLTLDEVVARLQVAKGSVESWVADGLLPSFKIGARRRVSEQALTEFVLKYTVKAKNPDWLTRELEEQFWNRIREVARQEVQSSMSKDKVERMPT